jgi:hypothetical protein
MSADEYWFPEKCVRPRLSRDGLLTLIRLVDNKYWRLRRGPLPPWYFREVSRLRLKLVRDLNRIRRPEHQISSRQRVQPEMFVPEKCAEEIQRPKLFFSSTKQEFLLAWTGSRTQCNSRSTADLFCIAHLRL